MDSYKFRRMNGLVQTVARRAPTTGVATLDLVVGGGLLFALAMGFAGWSHDPAWYLTKTFGFYLALCLLITALVPMLRPDAAFGMANRVTLMRGLIVCLIGGAIGETPTAHDAWTVSGLAMLAFVLDGVDGHVARRRGEHTSFGARFDMEVDALFILVLAALVWSLGKTGSWILLAGLMRYAFVVAGWIWPRLARPLAASTRRRAICALQGGALIICLTPAVTPAMAAGVAGFALIALTCSFLLDLCHLYGRR